MTIANKQPSRHEPSGEDLSNDNLAMTPQQRRFSQAPEGLLKTYKELIVGDKGWIHFIGFEIYNLLFASLPTILGLGLRGVSLGLFLKSNPGIIKVGRANTIRQPHRIRIAKSAVIDDFVTLDVRTNNTSSTDCGINIAEHVTIGRSTSIVSRSAKISISPGCNIGSNCRIASECSITLGKSVLVAAYCYIGPGNHRFDDPKAPIIGQGMMQSKGVVVGDNVWIGTRCTILDGVTIGQNAIIGAHSLVTEDVPPNAIVAGTPAKLIRMR